MNRYRSPAQRDAAWGRHYAKRMAVPPLTSVRPSSNFDRMARYLIRSLAVKSAK